MKILNEDSEIQDLTEKMETSGENAIVKKNVMKVQKELGVSSTLVLHGSEASSSLNDTENEDSEIQKDLNMQKIPGVSSTDHESEAFSTEVDTENEDSESSDSEQEEEKNGGSSTSINNASESRKERNPTTKQLQFLTKLPSSQGVYTSEMDTEIEDKDPKVDKINKNLEENIFKRDDGWKTNLVRNLHLKNTVRPARRKDNKKIQKKKMLNKHQMNGCRKAQILN